MSHSLSMPQPAPFSWRRSSALSATLGFHAVVLLLLLAPPVAQQLAPLVKPDPITVQVVDPPPPPPPPPPPIDVKPFVKPPPLARTPPPVAHTEPPPVIRDEFSPTAVTPPTEPPGPAIDSTPAETSPTPLGYGTRRAVPYPLASVRKNEQGTVILRVLIGSDGVPQRIEIEKSSGFPALDRAAREAVMKWRFTAGTRNGVPYTAWGRVPIEFQLDKQ